MRSRTITALVGLLLGVFVNTKGAVIDSKDAASRSAVSEFMKRKQLTQSYVEDSSAQNIFAAARPGKSKDEGKDEGKGGKADKKLKEEEGETKMVQKETELGEDEAALKALKEQQKQITDQGMAEIHSLEERESELFVAEETAEENFKEYQELVKGRIKRARKHIDDFWAEAHLKSKRRYEDAVREVKDLKEMKEEGTDKLWKRNKSLEKAAVEEKVAEVQELSAKIELAEEKVSLLKEARKALKSSEANELEQVGLAMKKEEKKLAERQKRNEQHWKMLLQSEKELIEAVEEELEDGEKLASEQIKKLEEKIKGKGKGKH